MMLDDKELQFRSAHRRKEQEKSPDDFSFEGDPIHDLQTGESSRSETLVRIDSPDDV